MAYYSLQQGLEVVLLANGFTRASREEGDAVIITHWVGQRIRPYSISFAFKKAGYPCKYDDQRAVGKGWTFTYPQNLTVSTASELVVIKVEPQ